MRQRQREVATDRSHIQRTAGVRAGSSRHVIVMLRFVGGIRLAFTPT
jgi:thiol:disulfide interchange protein